MATRRNRMNDVNKLRRQGEANADLIHMNTPRSERPYRAYRTEAAKARGERSPALLVELRQKFTPSPAQPGSGNTFRKKERAAGRRPWTRRVR